MKLGELDGVTKSLVSWAHGDVVNVLNMWDICSAAAPNQDPNEIRIRAAAYTAFLIAEGLMVPGVSTSVNNEYVFEPWQGPRSSWIALVVCVWAEIRDEPEPGQFFELKLTSSGKALAEQM